MSIDSHKCENAKYAMDITVGEDGVEEIYICRECGRTVGYIRHNKEGFRILFELKKKWGLLG